MADKHMHKWPLDCRCGAEAGAIIADLEQQLAQTREEIENLKGLVSESQLTNQRLREHGTTEAQHLKMELSLQERVREGLQKERDQAQDSLRSTLDQMTELEAEAAEMRALLEEWMDLTSRNPLPSERTIRIKSSTYFVEHPVPAQLEDDSEE